MTRFPWRRLCAPILLLVLALSAPALSLAQVRDANGVPYSHLMGRDTVTGLDCIIGTGTPNCAVPGGGGSGGGGAVTGASGSFVDGWNATFGLLADGACSTDAGTCTAQALTKRLIQRLTTINSTLGAPFQTGGSIGNTAFAWSASEAHGGEVGGNMLLIQAAQTVTASSAYASGNAVGGLMTLANGARVTAGSGLVQSVVINAKSAQSTQVDVFIFNANPTGSTCTDKTAFSLAAADFDKVLGVASITSTGWFSGGTASIGQAQNLAMPFQLPAGTSLYACAVTRATPTFTATTDISLGFRVIRN